MSSKVVAKIHDRAFSQARSTNSTNSTSQPTITPPAQIAWSRPADFQDTFSDYLYRENVDCQISSLDLHTPFEPLCRTRSEMLAALSGGGRIGFGAPYQPRGCDMHWFTAQQICVIMGRFEKVIFVGDSMMRHVVGALNVLLRENLGYGAVTDWNFSPKERYVPIKLLCFGPPANTPRP